MFGFISDILSEVRVLKMEKEEVISELNNLQEEYSKLFQSFTEVSTELENSEVKYQRVTQELDSLEEKHTKLIERFNEMQEEYLDVLIAIPNWIITFFLNRLRKSEDSQ